MLECAGGSLMRSRHSFHAAHVKRTNRKIDKVQEEIEKKERQLGLFGAKIQGVRIDCEVSYRSRVAEQIVRLDER